MPGGRAVRFISHSSTSKLKGGRDLYVQYRRMFWKECQEQKLVLGENSDNLSRGHLVICTKSLNILHTHWPSLSPSWNFYWINNWMLPEASVTIKDLNRLWSKRKRNVKKKPEWGQRELGKENELNGTETTIISTGMERRVRYY